MLVVLNSSQILSPWLGDIVDSGIGLSYRPAIVHRLVGRYDNPKPESTIFPSQGQRIWLRNSEHHKVLLNQEYTNVCPLVRIGTPHPLSRKRVCPPRTKNGRVRKGGGGCPISDDWRESLVFFRLYSVVIPSYRISAYNFWCLLVLFSSVWSPTPLAEALSRSL